MPEHPTYSPQHDYNNSNDVLHPDNDQGSSPHPSLDFPSGCQGARWWTPDVDGDSAMLDETHPAPNLDQDGDPDVYLEVEYHPYLTGGCLDFSG